MYRCVTVLSNAPSFPMSSLAGEVPYTRNYPDILGFVVTLIVTIVLAIGVKTSANYTSVFNALNILLVLFIIVTGLFYVNVDNWNSTEKFFPYGAHGVSILIL